MRQPFTSNATHRLLVIEKEVISDNIAIHNVTHNLLRKDVIKLLFIKYAKPLTDC